MYNQIKPSQQINWMQIDSEKYLKYAGYTVAGIAGIIFLGFVFRILAGTIKGYKELQKAIQF